MGFAFVGRKRARTAGMIVWLAASMLSGGCADQEEATLGPQVRDSAGVSLRTLPSEPAWDASEAWRLREELVVAGEGDGIPAFGYLVDLDVDRRGRIFVLDQQARSVYRFDPDGTLAGVLGGPGDGPGELGPLAASLVVRGDTVLVGDWSQDRLTRYGMDGSFLASEPIPGGGGARTWWKGSNGDVHLRSLRMYTDEDGRWAGDDLLLEYLADGSVDTVLAFDYVQSDLGAPRAPNVPMVLNAPSWTVFDGGRIAWLALEEGRVRIHDPDGTLRTILESERWRPRTPTTAEVAPLEEKLGDRMEMLGGSRDMLMQLPVEAPAALPAVTRVVAGPGGTLWVQHMGPVEAVHPMALNTPDPPVGYGGPVWDVVDPDGRWLGSLELPEGFRLMRIADGAVYGVARNDLDVDRIVRLRLER